MSHGGTMRREVEVKYRVRNVGPSGMRLYRHLRTELGIPRHEANFVMVGVALVHEAEELSDLVTEMKVL